MNLIRTSRPLFWLVHWTCFLYGAISAQKSLLAADIKLLISFLLFSLPFSLFTYAYNDYYDVQTDAVNKRKGGIFGQVHKVSFKSTLPVVGILGLTASVTLLAIINIYLVPLFLMLSLLLYFYSAPPLRFKNKPLIDFLVGGGFYILTPWFSGFFLYGGRWSYTIPQTAIFLFFLGCVLHIIAALFDYEADKEAHINTTPVYFGISVSIIFSLILSIVGMILTYQSRYFVLPFSITIIYTLLLQSNKLRTNNMYQKIVLEYFIYAGFLIAVYAAFINPFLFS